MLSAFTQLADDPFDQGLVIGHDTEVFKDSMIQANRVIEIVDE
jgi:hypothetical protein